MQILAISLIITWKKNFLIIIDLLYFLSGYSVTWKKNWLNLFLIKCEYPRFGEVGWVLILFYQFSVNLEKDDDKTSYEMKIAIVNIYFVFCAHSLNVSNTQFFYQAVSMCSFVWFIFFSFLKIKEKNSTYACLLENCTKYSCLKWIYGWVQ